MSEPLPNLDELPSPRRWRDLLSETERRQLLADIAHVGLVVGQDLFPERHLSDLDIRPNAATAAPGGDACPRERLAFLCAVWPRVSTVLNKIETAPHRQLIAGLGAAAPERATGRVTPAALLAALRTGDFAPAPPPSALLSARLGGRLPRRIVHTVSVPTFDTPANRALKTVLVAWARDLAVVAALAEGVGVPTVAADAQRLRVRVRQHLRRAPWRTLPASLSSTAPESALAASTVLRGHPLYRLVHDTFRRYRQQFGFDWTNPLFTLPAREAWLLYETWTFFQVAAALRALGLRAAFADGFVLGRAGLTFSLAKGSPSRLRFVGGDGSGVTLGYNLLFADDGRRSGYHARSHAMRPDIVLQRGDGQLLVFDAKFKTYAEPDRTLVSDQRANLPLVLDINQAHAYRDAIHNGSRRVVDATWLLYAGRGGGWPNRAVIAYPNPTPERPFGDGNVGALLLRPGGGAGQTTLRALIGAFLNAAPP